MPEHGNALKTQNTYPGTGVGMHGNAKEMRTGNHAEKDTGKDTGNGASEYMSHEGGGRFRRSPLCVRGVCLRYILRIENLRVGDVVCHG